jgi:hypothetical protein
MSDVAPIRPPTEVELSDDQRAGIEEANSWVSSSMAVLGEAYLEHEEARLAYELAEKKLRSCAATARQAEKQRAQVVKTIASMLPLEQGEWVYDGQGKMVRKDKPNG